MSRYLYSSVVLILIMSISSCSAQPDAQTIIDKAIEKHGGSAYENSRIAFTFRETRYMVTRRDGDFEYQRSITDSTGVIVDRLSNKGFQRIKNDKPVALTAQDSSAYLNSLNSVIYFAKLPYKLNDAAVNKKYIGKTTINGEPYYEIKVTFDQQGGGKDYDDEFVYWIHQRDYTVDYLAYKFREGNGGMRFREAYNVRTINGIRFADYNNFKGSGGASLEQLDKLFEEGKLEKVSEINLDSIEVTLLN